MKTARIVLSATGPAAVKEEAGKGLPSEVGPEHSALTGLIREMGD